MRPPRFFIKMSNRFHKTAVSGNTAYHQLILVRKFVVGRALPRGAGRPKLINFNTTNVTPFNGVISFNSTGIFHGNCTLNCHSKQHNPFSY